MNNESEKKASQSDVVVTTGGKSSKIRNIRKSIDKKGGPERKKKENVKYNNGDLIRVVKTCKHNDSIFDFIDGSYRRYFLVKRGNGVAPHTQVGHDPPNEQGAQSTHPPFIFFESLNAFELKKHPAGEAIFTTLFHMTKGNMERLYNESNFLSRGWSDEKKWKELRSDKCKLILGFVKKAESSEEGITSDEQNVSESLLTGSEPNLSFLQRIHTKGKNESTKEVDDYLNKHSLVSFVHYRLTADYSPNAHTTVCYLYEIQIVPEFTKMGIGKHLIGMLEALCRRINVRKILCTVLKSNINAVSFYKNKCSFQMDESSPDNFASEDSEECEYEILKRVVCS
ncbi:hypothetical protein C922_00026 [Plasmodium inui San Antonio 1]|uniref:N-alpha-acetyltransferase 40 n=1 Tax=Plasmodium inui San Antonio 1 TaxID=1237626 RepID=W7ACX8_9APIC|nr:hypothetical protein C922_00026 [Plasmodium inui San Antonio 1]EUD69163.1 hypothetical protein C922_00026 [Plasmodium inui San Antonio 1]